MKKIKIALLGLVLFNQNLFGIEKESEKKQEPKKEISKIPEIKNNLTLDETITLREELLLIQKDVEFKINKLELMKKAYDDSKQEIGQKLKDIEEQKKLLDESLQKEKKLKDDRLDEAVEFISKMEPRKAAPIFETMDRDLVLLILKKLPKRTATKLFENMSPAKSTQYLEYYTRIRSGREFEMLKDLGICSTSQENNVQNKK